ncbi:MAG: hypothetical protein NTZ55_04330 [Candidatus Roizmanbacteria bacterium]|nr:hypothetical protein [Candidatus Roizmanbacteria bacterium]
MIIFTVPKPFIGKFRIIQENAIDSWLSIKPKPKIILIGDEVGISQVAKSKHLIQIKKIKKNINGTPLLNNIFSQVQKNSKDKVFMYINTDIILLKSPNSCIKILINQFDRFLAVGKRYEMDLEEKIDVEDVQKIANNTNLKQKSNSWMDYFIFTHDVFDSIPPFALGKTFWDKWLVWYALQKKIPTIDITSELDVIHQTHSYSMNRRTNMHSVWAGDEALNNLRLAGGWSHGATIGDTNFTLIGETLYTKKPKLQIRSFILDIFPVLWPIFIKIRLMRERFLLIINK